MKIRGNTVELESNLGCPSLTRLNVLYARQILMTRAFILQPNERKVKKLYIIVKCIHWVVAEFSIQFANAL